MLEQTVARLREEFVAADRAELFEELRAFQPGEEAEHSYAEVAARLGLTESVVKSAIWRLRHCHRALLREEIAHTAARPADATIRFWSRAPKSAEITFKKFPCHIVAVI